ncbi:UNKNOWN [Stylonychia lemnae]|uniref:Uncharacterized protein n=1 Tax=Stylonychia lemnae TaxID=5949 RepID=A0A078ADE4_STYLE|nr:UNKNOWN [Stylonychia lemnae]|eukprot:CDW79866.1 UNKNOWN [Stylonychia lemnae]
MKRSDHYIENKDPYQSASQHHLTKSSHRKKKENHDTMTKKIRFIEESRGNSTRATLLDTKSTRHNESKASIKTQQSIKYTNNSGTAHSPNESTQSECNDHYLMQQYNKLKKELNQLRKSHSRESRSIKDLSSIKTEKQQKSRKQNHHAHINSNHSNNSQSVHPFTVKRHSIDLSAFSNDNESHRSKSKKHKGDREKRKSQKRVAQSSQTNDVVELHIYLQDQKSEQNKQKSHLNQILQHNMMPAPDINLFQYQSYYQNPMLVNQIPRFSANSIYSFDNSMAGFYSQRSGGAPNFPMLHNRIESVPHMVPPLNLNFFNDKTNSYINSDRNYSNAMLNKIHSSLDHSESTQMKSSKSLKRREQDKENNEYKKEKRRSKKRGIRTENHSVQCSDVKLAFQNTEIKTLIKPDSQYIQEKISVTSSHQELKFEIVKDDQHQAGRCNQEICEGSHRFLTQSIHQRKFSYIIAENVLESPNEREFRDGKNNNIWGLKEMDLRDKPEHNFSSEIDPCKNCSNCLKLQKEILRQQQYLMQDSQNTMKSNDLQNILSQIDRNQSQTYYPEVVIVNDNDSDGNFDISLDEVANERDSIRLQLDFNCNEQEEMNERRDKTKSRIQMCRSNSYLVRNMHRLSNPFKR